MKTLLIIAMMFVPAIANAETFGLGPEPVTPTIAATSYQTFGLGGIIQQQSAVPQSTCIMLADGTMQCSQPVRQVVRAVVQPVRNTVQAWNRNAVGSGSTGSVLVSGSTGNVVQSWTQTTWVVSEPQFTDTAGFFQPVTNDVGPIRRMIGSIQSVRSRISENVSSRSSSRSMRFRQSAARLRCD